MNSKQKKLILTLLKLVISITLLIWVIRKTNLAEVIQALENANIYFLIGALVVYCISYYLRALRWQALLRAKNIKTSLLYLYKSYFVGIFFSNFLPSIVGGDAVRVYDIWRISNHRSTALTTVLVDRILGLIILLLVAFGALLIVPQALSMLELSRTVIVSFLGILAIAIVAYKALSISHRIGQIAQKIKFPWWQLLQEKSRKIMEALMDFKDRKVELAQAIGWSVLVQIAVVTHYYLIAKALNFPTSLATFFLVVPLATVIMMLPISINAIGLRENAFVFLLGTFSTGVYRPETIAFSWLAYGIVVIQGLVGGLIYMLRK